MTLRHRPQGLDDESSSRPGSAADDDDVCRSGRVTSTPAADPADLDRYRSSGSALTITVSAAASPAFPTELNEINEDVGDGCPVKSLTVTMSAPPSARKTTCSMPSQSIVMLATFPEESQARAVG